jgi:hypothetical protein
LTKNESPAAAWLQAKLQRRKGQMNEAARSMEKAWEVIRDLSHYTGWSGTTEDRYLTGRDDYFWSFDGSASGDLGGLRLERADFVQALETFWRGGLWDDAAYVAEHVLSAAELREFVDQQSDAAGSGDLSLRPLPMEPTKNFLSRNVPGHGSRQPGWRVTMAWNSWEPKLPRMDLIRVEHLKMWTWQNNGLPDFGHCRPLLMVRKRLQKFRL